MNTDLKTKTKNDFKKYIFKLMNNAVFGKTMANVRKDRYIKLVITEKKKNYLISYYKVFHRTLVSYRNKKTQI